ncbi:MAG TPA: glycosyltransferase family 4 protein [Methylovirgula sp.]|nr:glycosyltransferase family 4 protein [Methylovirgula sp.]
MHIAQIAPLAESVPPALYGGTERVVAWLTQELVRLGHEVTLFASADSKAPADLVGVWPQSLRLGRRPSDPMAAYARLLEAVARQAKQFDVLHCHIDWVHIPLLRRLDVPFLTTLHGRLDLPGLGSLVDLFPDAPFISISDHQRIPLPQADWLGTVYHGLPADSLRPSFEPGRYLGFLGRLTADKGPEVAIRIAKAAGMPLKIAAKLPRGEKSYFAKTIAPLVDGTAVELVGEMDDRSKGEFLANASALVFPIHWPEPFGLVMIEAMACGTPVIAFRCGSVPEVVEEGVSGFIVETEDEAVAAIGRLASLDRREVRAAFERRFTAERMALDYVRCYERLLGRSARPIRNERTSAFGSNTGNPG